MAGIFAWSRSGKIVGLIRFNEQSGGALDYDCMTLLGVRLADVPSAFGWDGLVVFFEHLPQSSASWRWHSPDEAAFSSDLGRAALLADVFDAVRNFNFSFASKGSRAPEPHMRPWRNKDDETYGSDPIAVSEFDDWYYGR